MTRTLLCGFIYVAVMRFLSPNKLYVNQFKHAIANFSSRMFDSQVTVLNSMARLLSYTLIHADIHIFVKHKLLHFYKIMIYLIKFKATIKHPINIINASKAIDRRTNNVQLYKDLLSNSYLIREHKASLNKYMIYANTPRRYITRYQYKICQKNKLIAVVKPFVRRRQVFKLFPLVG